MRKKKSLKLLTPTKKTIFLGNHASQKAAYLQLPDNFEDNLLQDDVKNGASIYASCTKHSGSFSNYTIITAKTLEDGYRAVLYLAAEEASDEYFAEEIPDYTPSKHYIPEHDDIDIDDDYETDDPDYIHYQEHFSRIPLIPLQEIGGCDDPFSDTTFGNAFQMEVQKSKMRNVPWWMDCTEESICIVRDENCGGVIFPFESIFSDATISNLSRFTNNKHVYLLVVGNHISPEDYSISRVMLEYTASYYPLLDDTATIKAYHYQLLLDLCRKYEVTFSKSTDTRLLSEKLESIDSANPCATYEKTLKYILHTDMKNPVTPDVFKRMGLNRMINLEEDHSDTKQMAASLFGMETVKGELENIMNVLRYNKIREEHKLPPLNYHKTFLFIGAPGTAKTTMAQMLADQMAKEGFLHGNRFTSVNGAQLKAPFLGQTASLVHSLFSENDAILIDEAYSLTSSIDGQIDSYGQEALAQLAIELENHANDKLIIFAGYGGKKVSREHNKMLQFIEANPGLKSRINTTIYFDSYEPEVMVKIVHHLASRSELTISHDCDPLIQNYFAARVHRNDFGNGREARSLLEQCQVALANRLLNDEKQAKKTADYSLITKEDMEQTIQALSEMNTQQQGISSRFGYL